MTDYIQIALMAILVGTTIFYAWQARRTVSEMRLQRLTAKPVVVPDIDVHLGPSSYTTNMKNLAQSNFPVALTNVGTAAAIELELFLKTPRNESVSTKLPLLLAGANWRSQLTYVADFDEEGEPIFDQPPPEGLYELKVTFKSATSYPNVQFSEITLPFDLHWSGQSFYYKIEKHELHQNLLEAKQ